MGIYLPSNDKHIQHYQAIIECELSKGTAADTSKLLAALEAVNVFYHGNISGILRVSQRERAHKANESHEELVDSYKNLKAKILNAAGGGLGVAGAIFTVTIIVGATAVGVPFAGLQIASTIASTTLTAATGGFNALSQAASSGDQATQALHDHAVKNQQTERNDDQSTNQAVESQKAEALRRKKEVQQQESSAWSTAVSSLR